MGSLKVVVVEECIQILLEFLQAVVDLLPEGHPVEFIQDGKIQPLDIAIGPRMPGHP